MNPAATNKAAIEAAEKLTDSLAGVRKEMARINAYTRRSRRIIWIVVGSLIVDIVLTVVVALVAVQAHHASADAAKARQVAMVARHDNLALCQSSNKARAQQVALWDFVLHLGHQPRTAQQRKVIAEFQAHLDRIFAPRDCSHVTPGSP